MSAQAWLLGMLQRSRIESAPTANGCESVPPGPELASLDPATAPDDPEILALATAYARLADAEPGMRLLWGQRAYEGAARLWGAVHPTTVGAGRVYQRVLAAQGRTRDAARVCEQRLAAHVHAADPQQVLVSRSAYALALQRNGQCDQARAQTHIAVRSLRAMPCGFSHPATVLLSAAAVYAGCGALPAAVDLVGLERHRLVHLQPRCRHLAALWLSTVMTVHPGSCRMNPRPGTPAGDQAQYHQFWLAALNGRGSERPNADRQHD